MKRKKEQKHIWDKKERQQAELTETIREEFVRDVARHPQGIIADQEKYADGHQTFSPKILPANKEE